MKKSNLTEKEELEKFAEDLSIPGKTIGDINITMDEIVKIVKEVREQRYLNLKIKINSNPFG